MPLTPTNPDHALQIQSGILGRKTGHAFEDQLSLDINSLPYPFRVEGASTNHVVTGRPGRLLLLYIASLHKQDLVEYATAISTGALATSEEGRNWLEVNGNTVRRCKSDVILTLKYSRSQTEYTVGISTKQCNARQPTNAQLYFTTAQGFSNLLRSNEVQVSEAAIRSMRQFCGEAGFRPADSPNVLRNRLTDPRRFFWEEISAPGRREWEDILASNQGAITRLLLQKAYLDDPFVPEFLLHKTKRSDCWNESEVAIYAIDELVGYSKEYSGFVLRSYSVRKGSHKDPSGVEHLAPRFGIVQMQRGGQVQHPEQLQFNLEAGYFYKIEKIRRNVFSNSSC